MALLAAAAGLGGLLVALRYAGFGLTLTHYDARGHLIVARRIIDSITPGWQQIGAVWLPLPHLLNALPVQVDALYRNGGSGVAISIVCFAVSVGAIAWLVLTLTTSRFAAVAGAAAFALNPNVLYLQATPMTEPLLMALLLTSVALIDWSAHPDVVRDTGARLNVGKTIVEPSSSRQDERLIRHRAQGGRAAGWLLALACLTRYEAWPVTGAALAAAAWTFWRADHSIERAVKQAASIAIYPAIAVGGFLIFSRVVVGSWFANDFFVAENPAEGNLIGSMAEVGWGLRTLSGNGILGVAMTGIAMLTFIGFADRNRGRVLIPLALFATAAVPVLAFYDGHPYRIRYMVPLIAAQAVAAGFAAGVWRAARPVLSAMVIALAIVELRPLNAEAPMPVEAQWDRPNIVARDPVSRCLAQRYHHDTVMASMGSLGHYMQDLSQYGFSLRDFLHEGNGDIWLAALEGPQPFVGWILIEEKAEGGDMLAQIARRDPRFLDGFSRVCEGAGLALYRRDETSK